jgi:hypothetical protein
MGAEWRQPDHGQRFESARDRKSGSGRPCAKKATPSLSRCTPASAGGPTASSRFNCLSFPGYIFCRLDLGAHFSILTTPGVMHFVGIGKTPVPLPDREIDSIRAIADFGCGAGWEQSAD